MTEEKDFINQALNLRDNRYHKFSITISGVTPTVTRKKIPITDKVISFLPTGMTRCSPFFPMSKKDMKDIPFETLEWETPWGSIKQEGYKLSTYDEGTLLILLYLADKYKGETYATSYWEMLSIAGIKTSNETYSAIQDSLHRLTTTTITIDTPKFKMDSHFIDFWITGKQEKNIGIQLGKAIINAVIESIGLTNIDIRFRLSIRGDIAKSIYRFLQSQRPFYTDKLFYISLIKLCQAVNLPIDQETWQLRQKIKKAMKELQRKELGFIGTFKLDDKDVICVSRGEIKAQRRERRKLGEPAKNEERLKPKDKEHESTARALLKHFCAYKGKSVETATDKEWNDCVEAASKFISFVNKHRDKIQWWDYSYDGEPKTTASLRMGIQSLTGNIITAIEADRGRFSINDINSGWLTSDKTWDIENGRLMKFLRREELLNN